MGLSLVYIKNHQMLYQVIYLVLYYVLLDIKRGKGTPCMFDPVL